MKRLAATTEFLTRSLSTVRGRGRSCAIVDDESGLALISTLLIIVLVAFLVAGALSSSIIVSRTSSAEYEAQRAFYAAEAGAENALAHIEVAMRDGYLDEAELSNIPTPTLEGYTFDQYVMRTTSDGETRTITDGPYAGLQAFYQRVGVTSTATHEASDARATVFLSAVADAIPIFQFGYFHAAHWREGSASRKDWSGRVHADGGIYVSTSDGHFHDYMTTPGGVFRDDFEDHMPVGGNASKPAGIHVFIDDASSSETELSFDSGDTPDPDAFKAKSETDFDGRLRTGAFGVDSLKLPLPEGVPPREMIRPKDVNDTQPERIMKYAWKADMYVTVDLGVHQSQAAACDGNAPPGAPSLLPRITITRPYGGLVPSDAWKCRIFFWTWTTFYDNDEEGWIDVLDVQINFLGDWIIGPGDGVEVIYVEFINAPVQNAGTTDDDSNPAGMFDDAYFPVLRIKNGNQLPVPLTVGSEYPLIVQGHYNTTNWKPASLFGDRLTSLSASWDDANAQNNYDNDCRYAAACPLATINTNQYFAFIAGQGKGFVGCFHEDPGCNPSDQPPNGTSGSIRLLEDWKNGSCPGGRCTLTILGSFVYLWLPQIANWESSAPSSNATYRRPNRNWGFDDRLLEPHNFPPGTPAVGNVLRAGFAWDTPNWWWLQ